MPCYLFQEFPSLRNCLLRISPVQQGKNNRHVFGIIHLKERGPKRGHSEGNRGHEGGCGDRPEKKIGVLGMELGKLFLGNWQEAGWESKQVRMVGWECESWCGAKCTWQFPPGHAPLREILWAEPRDAEMEREAWGPGGTLRAFTGLWHC